MTRDMVASTALKTIYKKFYTGLLGMGAQARAEKLRRPAYYMGYYTALYNGYSEKEAIQYGVNQIGYKHAFYGKGDKQFAANTKAGNYLMQFAQYTWNAWTHWLRLVKEARLQLIKYAPQSSGARRFLDWAKFLSNREIKEAEKTFIEFRDGKRTAVTYRDINIVHMLLNRMALGSIMMQMAAVLMQGRGIANWQDPMIQALYGITESLIKLVDNPDDWDGKEEAKWLIIDGVFFLGAPFKMAMQAPLTEGEDWWRSWLVRGRVQRQEELLKRAINSIFGGDDKRYDSREYPDLFSPEWLIDKTILGMPLLGNIRIGNKKDSFKAKGLFGDEYTVDLPPANRPMKGRRGSRKLMTAKDRLRLLKDPRTYIPFSDFIWPIDLDK